MKMKYPSGVKAWQIRRFENAHENFTQPLDNGQSFDLNLTDPAWQGMNQLDQYNQCTKNLQWIIKCALNKRMAIRAMGSGWSLSKVAVSNDAIINTKRLRHKFTLSKENFRANFLEKGNLPENYRFLQCGNTMIDINDYLENESQPAKCIRASGGSNGQTIIGALSTNTHGASINYGAIPEMVLGIHIITGPDRHFYLERASRPVTNHKFHRKIGATYICDDDLFNAALVSFGSFGIIHGVLIEVEDRFLLEQKLQRVPYDDAMNRAVTMGDFTAIEPLFPYPLNDPTRSLYHFELAINLHDFNFGDPEKGVYLRTMHKLPYRSDYEKISVESDGYTYGDDTLGLMQTVLDKVESVAGFLNRILIPRIVNTLFDTAYARPDRAIGTMGETFSNTLFRGKLFSAAFCIDRKDVKRLVKHCQAVNKKIKFGGILGLRFVKGTQATMGFTKWENNCVIELDGVDAQVNHNFVRNLANRLEKDGIPYTMHWGKTNRILNEKRVEEMYGRKKVRSWKQQRSRIMKREVQEIFNNEFMERCGLEDFVPVPKRVSRAVIRKKKTKRSRRKARG